MYYQQTSGAAYESIKHLLARNERAVLGVIKLKEPCSDEDISTYLGWPINCVTPRRGSLVQQDFVYCSGQVVNKRGRNVNVWRARE